MSFALLRQSKTRDGKMSTPVKPIPHRTNNSGRESDIPLQCTNGNQSIQTLIHSDTGFDFGKIGIQTKLKISQPDDIYEQEADKIAEEVMRTSVSSPISSTTISDGEEQVGRKCELVK